MEVEKVVGLDAGHPAIPDRLLGSDIRWAIGGVGQAAAVNAAMSMSTGDMIAILEDDDEWLPGKLGYQLLLLADHLFVSCNQREIDLKGNFIRYNDFATPSGWLMTREVWRNVGPFDESFRFHVDTEWLGRLNRSGIRRAHLVHLGAEKNPNGWLAKVARHSLVVQDADVTEPLVRRTVNPGGGVQRILTDAEAALQSKKEHAAMWSAFGEIPW